MTYIKELATLTAAEMDDVYLRNVPAIVLEQYATRLIAAYTEGVVPRREPAEWDIAGDNDFNRGWNACRDALIAAGEVKP